MIFATVGTQLPFDRMIRAIDEWSALSGRSDILAQIGVSDFRPRHIQWVQSLRPAEFDRRFSEADLIISHAGMGTIITALELGKPIIVVPRRADLGEHRNDHQLATAKRFADMGLVSVAFQESELGKRIDELAANWDSDGTSSCARETGSNRCRMYEASQCRDRQKSSACPNLLAALQEFIADGRVRKLSSPLAPASDTEEGNDLHHHPRP